jgi:hypothetical protein
MNILDILSGVGYALDTPGAYTRGALAGSPGKRKSGREMLEALGLAGREEGKWDMGDFTGFGAEMLLDPLNLVGVGALKKVLGLAGKAKSANAASDALRASGGMPEEIVDLLHPSMLESPGKPKPWYHGTPHAFDKFQEGRAPYFADRGEVASGYAMSNGLDASDQFIPDDGFLRRPGVPDDAVANSYFDAFRGIHGDDAAASSYKRGGSLDIPGLVNEAEGHLARKGDAGTDALYKAVRPHYDRNVLPRNVRKHFLDVRNPYSVGADAFDELDEDVVSAFSGTARGMGHDAIQHPGAYAGDAAGLPEFNVTAAMDPSQVYSPWVAPRKKRVPKASPIAAAIFGHNAMARGYGD